MTSYSFMWEIGWKSFAVLGLAWIVVRTLRARSAALRHLIWAFAFAGLLALPALSIVLPTLRVPVAKSFEAAGFIFRAAAVDSTQLEQAHARSLEFASKANTGVSDWRLLLVLVWCGGSALSLARMVMGWISVEQLRQGANTFQSCEAGVPLLEGTAGSMPMTYGMFRPVIFLPADAREWPAERLRMVLAHERAHVRRGDVATQAMARVALSFFWWNPLAWFGWREFMKERERAADDLVLSGGESGALYARHLLEIARGMQVVEPGWPVVAMACSSQLEGRLAAILDAARDRSAPRRASTAIVWILGMCLIGPLAAMQLKSGQADPNAGKAGEFAGDMRAKQIVILGDRARDTGKLAQARSLYSDAINLSPASSVAYLRRGTVELGLKDAAAAMSDFEQAGAVDAAYLSESKMWQAIAQEQQGNPEVADGLYQQAVAAGNPQSAMTATALELYAHFLEKQGKRDQGTSMKQQALEIRKALINTPSSDELEAVKAGGNVRPPELISKVEPEYSEEARVAHYSGTILLAVVIGEDGTPMQVRVVRGLGFGLEQKAIEAVNKWRFKPGSENGNPVRVRANVEVSFRLL